VLELLSARIAAPAVTDNLGDTRPDVAFYPFALSQREATWLLWPTNQSVSHRLERYSLRAADWLPMESRSQVFRFWQHLAPPLSRMAASWDHPSRVAQDAALV
jgi:hypothetical protein